MSINISDKHYINFYCRKCNKNFQTGQLIKPGGIIKVPATCIYCGSDKTYLLPIKQKGAIKHQFNSWALIYGEDDYLLIPGTDNLKLSPTKHHAIVHKLDNQLYGYFPVPVLVTVEEIK